MQIINYSQNTNQNNDQNQRKCKLLDISDPPVPLLPLVQQGTLCLS